MSQHGRFVGFSVRRSFRARHAQYVAAAFRSVSIFLRRYMWGRSVRLVVGITGATGSILGVRILQDLRELGVETHLVLSRWGRATLEMETGWTAQDLRELADHTHSPGDMAAPISSGSFSTDGMIIAPCSMKTLAAIRLGYGEGLIPRAADVTLKEQRTLVLAVRETPLHEMHLENMLALARMRAVILPPMPAFYNRPKSIEDLITHLTARTLDQFGLALPQARRWNGRLSQTKVNDSA